MTQNRLDKRFILSVSMPQNVEHHARFAATARPVACTTAWEDDDPGYLYHTAAPPAGSVRSLAGVVSARIRRGSQERALRRVSGGGPSLEARWFGDEPNFRAARRCRADQGAPQARSG